MMSGPGQASTDVAAEHGHPAPRSVQRYTVSNRDGERPGCYAGKTADQALGRTNSAEGGNHELR